MAGGMEENRKYALFEFLDSATVTFRRSDMDYQDIRRQFLDLLLFFLRVTMTEAELGRALARVPESCGDYLGFRALGSAAEVFKAEREPGVNSGENPLITSIVRTPVH